MDSLPTVDTCCFSCQLKPGTITIGILGCFILFSETSFAYHESKFDDLLVRISVLMAALFAIASLLLVFAAFFEYTTIVTIYVYLTLVYVCVVVIIFAVKLFNVLTSKSSDFLSDVNGLISTALEIVLLFYFIIVVNSFRQSIE